jgi:hypothetical protein
LKYGIIKNWPTLLPERTQNIEVQNAGFMIPRMGYKIGGRMTSSSWREFFWELENQRPAIRAEESLISIILKYFDIFIPTAYVLVALAACSLSY